MANLIHPELSYNIVAALYEVQRNLGGGYQEKYYQKSLAKEFSLRKIKYKEQLPVELKYKNESLGRYFLDFLVEDKIVLEIKSDCKFYSRDIKQVLGYLRAKNLELGILACFSKKGLIYKRILKGK
jgi:GxxExxY protein